MDARNGLKKTPSPSEQVIALHEEGFRNCEIMYWTNLNRSKVAGIIWRYKNPGMYKKNVPNTRQFRYGTPT